MSWRTSESPSAQWLDQRLGRGGYGWNSLICAWLCLSTNLNKESQQLAAYNRARFLAMQLPTTGWP